MVYISTFLIGHGFAILAVSDNPWWRFYGAMVAGLAIILFVNAKFNQIT